MSLARLGRWLGAYQWEVVLVLLIAGAVVVSSLLSPYYLDAFQILTSLRSMIVPGLLALGLMLLMVLGDIDISLPSVVAVGTVILALSAGAGVPAVAAMSLVLFVGLALGFVNGVLVTRLNLPAIAVTLGTAGAIRAIAFLLGGTTGYKIDDRSYVWLGAERIGIVPFALLLLLVMAGFVGVLLHRTTFGRALYAMGLNREAARYSGIRVDAIRISTFVIAGFIGGVAAIVFAGQYASARADNADGVLLPVVTAVVLGGVDINGGRGRVVGVLLSLLLIGTLQNGMGLANVQPVVQTVALGVLLIVSVFLPAVLRAATRLISRRITRGEPAAA